MVYDKKHTENDCDRCLKTVGKENLIELPYIYLDRNDNKHKDYICPVTGIIKDYKQYRVCKDCIKIEKKILKYKGDIR